MVGVRRTPKKVSWHERSLANHIGSRIFISEDITRLSEAAGLSCPSIDRHPQLLASLNRALFDAHSQSDVERTFARASPGELIGSFEDIARNARQLLTAFGIESAPIDLVGKSWSEIAEGSGIVRAMIHTIPPSCLVEDSALNQYIAAGEDRDRSRIAARDRMLVGAVRGVGALAIAAEACSTVVRLHKDERRGPRPNPLPPAILDQLINVFWEMFDQAPTMRSRAGLLGGPIYDWVQTALVIARDRLEPERIIRKPEKNALLQPRPPWSAAPTSSVEKPAARRMKRRLSSFEENVLYGINRLLGSAAMNKDLEKAIKRWERRIKTSTQCE
jgi:hypothetical protein